MEADVKGHQLNQPTPEKVTTVDPNLNPPRIPGCHCPSVFFVCIVFVCIVLRCSYLQLPIVFVFLPLLCHCCDAVLSSFSKSTTPLHSQTPNPGHQLSHWGIAGCICIFRIYLKTNKNFKIGLSRNLVDLVGSVGCLDQLVDSRCSASALSSAFPLCRDAWVNRFVSKGIILLASLIIILTTILFWRHSPFSCEEIYLSPPGFLSLQSLLHILCKFHYQLRPCIIYYI